MMNIPKLVRILGVSGCVLLGLQGTARSDTLMSRAGHAFFLSDAPCFSNTGWNGVQNTCGSTKTFESPINNRFGGGTRSFSASTTNFGLGVAPVCTAVVVSSGGALVWGSTATAIFNSGSPKPLGSSSTSATDTFNVNCDITNTVSGGTPLNSVGVN